MLAQSRKMNILLLVIGTLAIGIWLGFIMGVSRTIKAAVKKANPDSTANWYVVGGLVCCMVALGAILYSVYFLAMAEKTSGTVTELRERRHWDHDTVTYAPVVRFNDADGVERSVTSGHASYPPAYTLGQTVPVRFLKAHSENARIDDFWDHWGAGIILGGLGVLCVFVGYAIKLRRHT